MDTLDRDYRARLATIARIMILEGLIIDEPPEPSETQEPSQPRRSFEYGEIFQPPPTPSIFYQHPPIPRITTNDPFRDEIILRTPPRVPQREITTAEQQYAIMKALWDLQGISRVF